eukprot:NODE_15_length_50561_cov_0.608081.p24 type:complete len:235 gc:universal NODE_15_length_50561_cov_0.608081:43002-43706(+)
MQYIKCLFEQAKKREISTGKENETDEKIIEVIENFSIHSLHFGLFSEFAFEDQIVQNNTTSFENENLSITSNKAVSDNESIKSIESEHLNTTPLDVTQNESMVPDSQDQNLEPVSTVDDILSRSQLKRDIDTEIRKFKKRKIPIQHNGADDENLLQNFCSINSNIAKLSTDYKANHGAIQKVSNLVQKLNAMIPTTDNDMQIVETIQNLLELRRTVEKSANDLDQILMNLKERI